MVGNIESNVVGDIESNVVAMFVKKLLGVSFQVLNR